MNPTRPYPSPASGRGVRGEGRAQRGIPPTTSTIPSPAQLETYQRRAADRPVVLFYRFDQDADAKGAQTLAQLAELARTHRGHLRWHGREEQVLIGPLTRIRQCARLHFRTRGDALALVRSAAHEALFAHTAQLQLAVLNEQPRASRCVIALMALALPHWPFFDNTTDPGPEPGLGTSIMPTPADYETFLAHPDPQRPIVMVNWLRFRERAQYAPGEHDDGITLSGQAAYYRCGKVAFLTLHSLGARALFVSRYQQILIGHDGDPGAKLWHEFAMVEYPGRASFKRMTALRRYRAALHHRAAGLAENGQGLVVTSAGDE
jgi:hypothetical protein